MIVVEGPDNVGKTTACRRLAEMTGWPVEHHGPPTRGLVETFEDARGDVILDRAHLGNLVYQGLLHAGGPFDMREFLRVAAQMSRRGTVVCLHAMSPAWYHERLDPSRSEEHGPETRWRANNAFVLVSRMTLHGVQLVDVPHDLCEDGWPTDDHLRDWIRAEERRSERCGS
jgi:hypothetical protein